MRVSSIQITLFPHIEFLRVSTDVKHSYHGTEQWLLQENVSTSTTFGRIHAALQSTEFHMLHIKFYKVRMISILLMLMFSGIYT